MEEVSLREYIEVILRWKWFIILLVIVAAGVTGVFSFFVLPAEYESEAVVLLTGIGPPQISPDSSLNELLQSLTSNLPMTLEGYRQQVTNPAILQQVLDELKLTPTMTVASLRQSIRVENPGNTQLLRIIVSHSDPQIAEKLANALASEFISFVNGANRQRLTASTKVLAEQVSQQEQDMEKLRAEYEGFLRQKPTVTEVETELEAKTKLLGEQETRLAQAEVDLGAARAAVAEAERQLASTPQVLVTSRKVMEDPLLADLLQEASGKGMAEVAGIDVKSEEVNPTYVELRTQKAGTAIKIEELQAEQAGLVRSTGQLRQDVQELEVVLSRRQQEKERLETLLQKSKENYGLLTTQLAQARVAAAVDSGSANITLMAPAFTPTEPVRPQKMLNMAVAVVLALMAGVLIAFFGEYWRNSSGGQGQHREQPAETQA
ncbi:MAG: hypothetical protein D9V47_07715 [Clostridia bacterium]|nr:MAG: hypothetical protein D9V47_07715 [Clostridia bacterium]